MKAEDILSEVLRRYEEALKKRGVSAKTLADAQDLSGKLGKDLGRILAEELLKAFPTGAVPEDVAMGVIPAALRRNSDIVSGFVREIQKRLNEAARVPTPPELRFRYERSANLARWVSKQESFADHETFFSQYVEQNSRMTVDDAVRDQVKAHYGMGLSPKIIRKAAPGCCGWCTKHAGTVDYGPGMDKEIFRRHMNCPCVIEYDPGNGARDIKRVENYRFSKDTNPEEIERRKHIGENPWRGEDVTAEYFGTATPGAGSISREEGFRPNNHQDEIRVSEYLHKTFGGDITLLRERAAEHELSPDYLWRGKLWDLKTPDIPLGKQSINNLTRSGLNQISKNPGGIIFNLRDDSITFERIRHDLEYRLSRSARTSVDILIMHNGRVDLVLRYKK